MLALNEEWADQRSRFWRSISDFRLLVETGRTKRSLEQSAIDPKRTFLFCEIATCSRDSTAAENFYNRRQLPL